MDQNIPIKENISCAIVEDVVFCSNDSIVLTAIPGFNGNTCRWYSSDSSLTILNVDTLFTPQILGDTVFYVATFDSLHRNESLERMPLFVRVNPQPANPVVSDVHRCEIGLVNLSATMGLNATTCYWYASLDSITPMVTGTFYSDTITETTTYFVSGVNENTGCESSRIPIVASLGFHSDTTFFEASICRGEDYLDNGFELLNQTTTNTYFILFENTTGCDSIVQLNLTVNPHSDITIFDTIILGNSYTENGFDIEVQEEAGTQLFQNNLENEFSCDSTVFLYLTIIEDQSGIADLCKQGVRIYPNPASDLLYIALAPAFSEEVEQISLFDIYGKLLFRIPATDRLIMCDLSGYASGIYVLKIDTPNRQLTQKIIKK
ncbi:MAG: T9SS type A sorting domain-containing protein [Bacteroidales bacterium]|nr:T9SS type A sorting domain-containing protein [Bacteroidales bacterium]